MTDQFHAPAVALFGGLMGILTLAVFLLIGGHRELLGKDLKVQSGAEGVKMVHVGSQGVRDVIEEHQPMMGLHGHIHESSGFTYIGKTVWPTGLAASGSQTWRRPPPRSLLAGGLRGDR